MVLQYADDDAVCSPYRRRSSGHSQSFCQGLPAPWSHHEHQQDQALHSELSTGQRAPVGQKKRYEDNITTNLKKFHINSSNWEATASQRSAWRKCLHEGATLHEDQLQQAARLKKLERKERPSTKQAPTHPTASGN